MTFVEETAQHKRSQRRTSKRWVLKVFFAERKLFFFFFDDVCVSLLLINIPRTRLLTDQRFG